MAWQWFDSTLVEIKDLTHNTKLFTLKVDSEDRFEFEAGQFITLDLPIGEKKRDGWRSYSIANTSNDQNLIELCIVRLEGGAGTHYLFDIAEEGTNIRFKGPSGHFVLPEDKSKNIVCICTGTGIAPFRGMWQALLSDHLRDASVIEKSESGSISKSSFAKASEDKGFMHIIFGTRKYGDVLFEEEMNAVAQNNPDFKVDICLSREEKDGYHKGYVHQVYMDRYKGKTDDTLFYLCGWSEMIDEAVKNLMLELKVDRKQIIYELFG